MKKKISIAVTGGIVILLSILIYWFYFSSPSSFPDKNQMVKEMNDLYPEAPVRTVQKLIRLDSRHVYAPIITTGNQYAFSCWTWNKHKWELTAFNTMTGPYLWKINEKDPSSYRLIWNIRPSDHLHSIQFFFMRNRGYHVSNGMEHYDPKILMKKEVSVQGKSYGFMKLPQDLISVIRSYYKVESDKQPDILLSQFFSKSDMSFGWIPYDEKGKEAKLIDFDNGNGFGQLGGELEWVQFLSNMDLDF